MLNSEKQSKHGLITFKTLTRGNRWLISFKIGIESRHASLQLEFPTQVFSCEYCEIFKNSLFIKHLRWLLQFDKMLLRQKKSTLARLLFGGDPKRNSKITFS